MTTHSEVAAFMEGYYGMFAPELLEDTRCFDSLVACFDLPFIVVTGTETLVQDESTLRQALPDGLTIYIGFGWAFTDSDYVQVLDVNPNLAFVTKNFFRRRGDGTVFEEGGATYTVIKCDGSWRIAAVAMHGAQDRLTVSATSQ